MYTSEYNEKLVSAKESAALIKSGDWVDFGWACSVPADVDAAIADRVDELYDVNFRGGLLSQPLNMFSAENAGEHLTWNSFHVGGIERKYISRGFAYYVPMRYGELPRYYREHIRPADVAYVQVTPMDEYGFFNFGPCNSHLLAMCETAKCVVVEVNSNLPYCPGGYEECIHISKVDYIVEGSNSSIPCTSTPETTEVDKAVARLIVEEIPNGACLQLGIGGMPNAVGNTICESDLKDLGVHTEMYVDAFVNMVKAGKVTGSKKPIDRFRQTFTFAGGSRETYDYLNHNPSIMTAPVDYTNDVRIIASIDNFISINNAIDIDLYGQVNAESAGLRHISGTGGQLDFVMGAYLSRGGKSFICCSSTFKDKEGNLNSRIRPTLAPGSIVTDPRSTAQYIVTEYGKVCLKGLSTWQRAELLISLAHPDFRDELVKEAEKMKIWKHTNK